MNTLVVQSYKSGPYEPWIKTALSSALSWAELHEFEYEFCGDEVFELLPSWFREKFEGRGPQLSDLARLLLIQNKLESGYERVVWADADLLVFRPEQLVIPEVEDSLFGLETWVDFDSKAKLRFWHNVHNAFMVFTQSSAVLPYLIFAIQSIAKQIRVDRFAPQTFGPKLLGALHNISNFETMANVGALSPTVRHDLLCGGGKSLALQKAKQKMSPAALNLCLSLSDEPGDMATLCSLLVTEPDLLSS